MIYLTLADLLHVAERTLGGEAPVRDQGLLQSALARPQASAFGSDAYPSVVEKAAALLHSLARNHALVDGNKPLALAATLAFLGINGVRLTLTNDEAYELVMAVAAGQLEEIPELAERIRNGSRPGENDVVRGMPKGMPEVAVTAQILIHPCPRRAPGELCVCRVVWLE